MTETTATSEHEVVVAGSGPTGLMLAAELALAGVAVAVVERRPDQQLQGTRARGLHARTLEVLDQRGVAERFISAGQTVQAVGFAFNTLDISDFPSRHAYVLALAQGHVERILAAWVSELPVVMYRACEVTGFTQGDRGVEVALSDGRSLRAQYLVGCDGGRSLVRRHAGIAFPGWDASMSFLLAEAELAEEAEWGVQRDERGMRALGPLEDGRRVGILIEQPAGAEDDPTLDDLRAGLVASYGTDYGVHDVTWLTRFTDASRQAAAYRVGRVLLAGDAAHVHGPAGGQGLNTGMQDAVNLGWKLAQVVHGTSPEALLDTYHAERHPVGARVLRNTMAQSALNRGDERTAALNETVSELLRMEEPRRRIAGMISGLDIHYDLAAGEGAHPLVGRRMPDLDLVTETGVQRMYTFLHDARAVLVQLDASRASDVTRWGEGVRAVEARYDGAWELPVVGAVPAPGAVLVRPDGHVAWVGDGGTDGLDEALRRWCGEPAT